MAESRLPVKADVHGLVSIVMPAYNAADVIGEAIRSVLAQTYQHWELLITDDGSIDSTASVVRSFVDPRIHLLCQDNKGVSEARNRGLDAASGEFITFLDADDALPPKSVESRAQLLQRELSVDVVAGHFIVCGPELNLQLKCRYPGLRGPLLPRLLRLDERVFHNVCYFLRKSLIGQLRFQSKMTHAEDLLFFIKIAAINQPIYAPLDEATYLYRTGTNSAMSNLDGWENGYFQLINSLHRMPQLTWKQCLPTHRRVARILLFTWLKNKKPIRAFLSSARVMVMALTPP